MANYYASARSNYFRVKDLSSFENWAGKFEAVVIRDNDGRVGLLFEGDSGGIPSVIYSDNEDGYEDIDFAGELSKHLAEGEVAVLMEAGAEKLRYINGYAIAVNSKGESVSVSLDDIYTKAEKLGQRITRATY